MFSKFLGYYNPPFLRKDLHKTKQAENEQLTKQINDALIDLRNAINKKQIPEIENIEKVTDIVENIFEFNKEHRVKGLKTLTSKQML